MPRIDNLNGDELSDIFRRLRALETAPKLGNSSISGGTLTVRDTSGAARVRIGQLSSVPNGYGVEVLVGAEWVPLSNTAAGGSMAAVEAALPVDAAAGKDTAWDAANGPAVTVTTYTGRIDVEVGAHLYVRGPGASAVLSYSILDGRGQEVVGPGRYRGVAVTDGGGGGASQQASSVQTHKLAAGTYTVQARSRVLASASAASSAVFTNRVLGAQGY
ncbi:tail protein [Arthrobacter phage Abidatro]|uniref:Uncharacterized protein n=1 Tax=Arthrobacter phage Abidatro TaxID=2015853 RepID=A0A222ZFT5_9CAUD|nr:tail protein [Arthrobacter phage Abidatro]ASR83189.1 hypothetical protein SEA_ABIDATRO_19 [Arthrobacter phage Abidatro]